MSGPKNERGADAFDDFFGDPTPSGRMGPAPDAPGATPFADDEDEPTQDVELRRAHADQPTHATPPAPVITPAPTPQDAVPDGWWDEDPTTVSAAAEPAQSSTWHATPQPAPAGQPAYVGHQQPPRRGLSTAGVLAALVGGLLVGGLCVGGAVMALSGDDPQPTAQQTTVTETSTPQAPSTSIPTSTAPSSTTSSSSSSSSSKKVKRTGTVPAGVKQCSGAKQGTAVGRGTDVTSCEFATAVRDAYLAAKPKDGSARLEVRSPVTRKNYTMSCSGAVVTRCTGGNDAVVVLY